LLLPTQIEAAFECCSPFHHHQARGLFALEEALPEVSAASVEGQLEEVPAAGAQVLASALFSDVRGEEAQHLPCSLAFRVVGQVSAVELLVSFEEKSAALAEPASELVSGARGEARVLPVAGAEKRVALREARLLFVPALATRAASAPAPPSFAGSPSGVPFRND